jgi:hypothetical protein
METRDDARGIDAGKNILRLWRLVMMPEALSLSAGSLSEMSQGRHRKISLALRSAQPETVAKWPC